MSHVTQLRAAHAAAPSTSNVLPLFRGQDRAPASKADGVFADVNIAARQMGVKHHMALQYARAAKKDYLGGKKSAEQVVAHWKAALRKITRQVRA